MNRRIFLKSIGSVVAGMAGLCLLPKKKRVKCKMCRDRGRVWSQDIKEDIDMVTTPQLVLSVRSCDCPAGIAREKRLNPMKAEIVNKDFQHSLLLKDNWEADNTSEFIDFSMDGFVYACVIKERAFVFCEHSVFEVLLDEQGELLLAKQREFRPFIKEKKVCHYGIRDFMPSNEIIAKVEYDCYLVPSLWVCTNKSTYLFTILLKQSNGFIALLHNTFYETNLNKAKKEVKDIRLAFLEAKKDRSYE